MYLKRPSFAMSAMHRPTPAVSYTTDSGDLAITKDNIGPIGKCIDIVATFLSCRSRLSTPLLSNFKNLMLKFRVIKLQSSFCVRDE